MKAINLISGDALEFDDKTVPMYAVVYGYCSENNLMSRLFFNVHNQSLDDFYIELPLYEGKKTIACGDWVCRKEVN